MSGLSKGYRHVHRTGQQGTRPPVLSQAGVEKYATGKLSLPSNHLKRLNKTKINLNKKNTEIKTIINTKKFSIGTINLQTAKDEIKLA